jgi:RNA polymerase sigma-70 factor (ECF subfamily)
LPRQVCNLMVGRNQMQEQILINRLKQQDSKALAQLYDAYGNALFGVVFRIVHTQELAEQVLQDTFLKAWRNIDSYDAGKGRLFTWLLNIARNTAIDATRTAHFQNSQKTDAIDTLVSQPSTQTLNPETLGLRELVGRLDDKYKEIIDLIYFKGHTQEETAEITGIPIGTIKTRLRYAINELRNIFGENQAA